jgi:hypothetical protein
MSGHEAVDAGLLVAFGFSRRQPTDGSDYGRVYERYRAESEFRDLVDGFCLGLGLTVLGTPPTGIVLAPTRGSPFFYRISELGFDSVTQLVVGLVLLGTAALAYPTDEALDATSSPTLRIAGVERFLRGAIEPLRALEAPPEAIDAWIASAAAAYDRLPPFIPTKVTKRAQKGCSQWAIEAAVELLVDQGMARDLSERFGAGTFLLTDRFRVMVGEIAASDALLRLRELARTEPQPGAGV